ncbi:hypothetical protein [Paenibacillus hamazuiensis]|uniref:hypothetical protein n=1 Tax=Paenibacillus hamazuiensis TaxID=2936508 RepID=UPI00200D7341|nr:hypothetical protein [Paenibacillus hamazuiensis]
MNIPPLPQSFDANEWFVLVISISAYSLMWLLPRRFPPAVSVFVFLFGLFLARWADHIFGTNGAFDFYDTHDSPKMELADLCTYPMYAAFGYLFVYIYDRLGIRGRLQTSLFIVFCSLAGTGLEYAGLRVHMFTYKGWNLFFSFLFYMLALSLTIVYFHWIRREYARISPSCRE